MQFSSYPSEFDSMYDTFIQRCRQWWKIYTPLALTPKSNFDKVMYRDLERRCKKLGYTVKEKDIGNYLGLALTVGGYDGEKIGTILLSPMYNPEKGKTLAHEMGHMLRRHAFIPHSTPLKLYRKYYTQHKHINIGRRGPHEFEAETISYLVGMHYGLNYESTSIPYIYDFVSYDNLPSLAHGRKTSVLAAAGRIVGGTSPSS